MSTGINPDIKLKLTYYFSFFIFHFFRGLRDCRFMKLFDLVLDGKVETDLKEW